MDHNKKLIPERPETSADECKKVLGDIMVIMQEKYSGEPFTDHFKSVMMSLKSADSELNKIRQKEIYNEKEG